jgi:hypothetical protein
MDSLFGVPQHGKCETKPISKKSFVGLNLHRHDSIELERAARGQARTATTRLVVMAPQARETRNKANSQETFPYLTVTQAFAIVAGQARPLRD